MPLIRPTPPPGTDPGQAVPAARLDAADPTERRRAALDRAYPDGPAADLCRRLPVENEPAVREAILTALMTIGGPQAVDGLLPLLRSEDAALRNGAIEALQKMDRDVVPHVENLFADPDSDVRIFAVNIVEALRHPLAPAWLFRLVQFERHINVCAAAVDALAEIGTPDMVPALETLTDRFPNQPFLHFAVRLAIRRITGEAEP
ncbi:MAG TPA: HEAT repeat domain-containing protein [Azospirillaceae bacterium]|nr:HEAT repeat domain-containing protein [Azospirillaceae bacterium]